MSTTDAVMYIMMILYQDVVCNDSKRCNKIQLMKFDSQSIGDFLKILYRACNFFLVSSNLNLVI